MPTTTEETLRRLVLTEVPMLRAVISRTLGRWQHAEVDGEDILQETLLRALQKLPQLNSPTPSSLRGWLARIARNLCIDKTRHHHAIGHDSFDPEALVTRTQTRSPHDRRTDLTVLNSVSTEERMILCLRVSQGLSWETIQQIVNKPSVRMTRIVYYKVVERLRRVGLGQEAVR